MTIAFYDVEVAGACSSYAMKILKNSQYGKFGDPMITNSFNIKKAYKGEWKVEVPWTKWREVTQWCQEAYGEGGRNHRYRWRKNHLPEKYCIFLKNEADITMFRLRWL